MARNVSVTFEDGTKTVYRNVPDDVTPEQIQTRAQQENNATVIEIDGGAQLPEEAAAPTMQPVQPPVMETPAAAPTTPATPVTPEPTTKTPFDEQNVDLMGMGDEGAIQTGKDVGSGRSYITSEEASADPTKVTAVRNFWKMRYPLLKAPEDDVELMNEYASRLAKSDVEIAEDLTWTLNATPRQKEAAFMAQALVGENIVVPFTAEISSALRSPTTYASAGAGFIAKKVFAKSIEKGIQYTAKVAAATMATDMAGTAGRSYFEQKTKTKTTMSYVDDGGKEKTVALQDDISFAELGLQVGVSALFSGVEGAAIARTAKESPQQTVAKMVAENKKTGKVEDAVEKMKKIFATREKEVAKDPLFASPAERKKAREGTLDVIDEPEEITEAVLDESTVDLVYKTARQMLIDNPDLIPDDLEKRSITQVIADLIETQSPDAIQQAASKAGISTEDFVKAFKVQVSEAGAILQQSSTMAKFLSKSIEGVDPELEKAVNRMVKAGSGKEDLTKGVWAGVRRFTDASVGLAVTGLYTTVQNAFSLAGVVTVGAAVGVLETTVRTTSSMLGTLRGGVPIQKLRLRETVKDNLSDSLTVMGHLLDNGFSNELFDIATKNNPRIKNLVIQSSPEGDRAAMGRFATQLNVFNRALESFIRKPAYIAALERRMKDIDLDMNDFIANDKAIPTGLLELAAKDALDLTFSSVFKRGGRGVEGSIESMTSTFVNAVNQSNFAKIGANIVFPFFRFSLSHMKYAYRLTPVSGMFGVADLRQAAKLNKLAGEAATKADALNLRMEAAGIQYNANKKILTSAVGFGLLYAGARYREENADIPMTSFRSRTGEIYDIANIPPISTILAMAEAGRAIVQIPRSLVYMYTMTEDERKQEITDLKKQAKSLAVSSGKRQDLLNDIELIEKTDFSNFDFAKFSQVMFGISRMGGTQKTFIESVYDTLEGGVDEKEATDWMKGIGRGLGDFLSRFDNFLNPIYDIVNMAIEDYRVVDTKEMKEPLEFVDFGEAVLGGIGGPIPVVRNVFADRPSLFTSGTQQAPTAARYVTGINPKTPTTVVENELYRLGVEPFRVLPRDEDRKVRNIVIKEAQPNIMYHVKGVMEDSDYKDKSTDAQRVVIQAAIKSVINSIKKDVEDNVPEDKRIERAYARLPKNKKKVHEDLFFQENGKLPTTVDDKQDIIEGLYDYTDDLSEYARGGLASQTRKAFSR